MPAAEWTDTFGPFDEQGRHIPFDEHPLTRRGPRTGGRGTSCSASGPPTAMTSRSP